MKIREDGLIHFTNGDPVVYDWLSEIEWAAKPICKNCGELKEEEIFFESYIYDGLHWESPKCCKCDKPLQGAPINLGSRNKFFEVRPNLKEPSNEFQV